MSLFKKYAWYGSAVVASALLAVALLVAGPAERAFADVTSLATNDAVLGPGETATLTATIDGEPAGTETITFFLAGTGTSTGGLGDDEVQTLVCTVTVGLLAGGGLDTDCDDGDGHVYSDDVPATVAFTATLTAATNATGGQLIVVAEHEGDTEQVTVFVVTGTAGAVSDVETVSAPSSIADAGGTATVIVRAVDANGNAINGVSMNVSSTRGNLRQSGNVCSTATADPFTDNNCTVTTAGTGTSMGRATVHAQESGSIGQNVQVTFVVPNPVPVVEQATMTIVGVPATATLSGTDTAPGTTSTITVTALDAAGNPVANDTSITVAASAGTVAACSNGSGATGMSRNGIITCTYVAPTTAQDVVITAVVEKTGDDIVVTDTIAVGAGGTTPPPTTGEGNFDRPIPNTGVNTAVWNGGTVAQLSAATAAGGGISVTVFVGGQATVLIPGAPAFVNAAFNAAFPTGAVPSGTIVLVVR